MKFVLIKRLLPVAALLVCAQGRSIESVVDTKNADMPYSFRYRVADEETGDFKSRAEVRDEQGTVTGSYCFLQPDGCVRVVHYTADATGFHPTVTYEGDGCRRSLGSTDQQSVFKPNPLFRPIKSNSLPGIADRSTPSDTDRQAEEKLFLPLTNPLPPIKEFLNTNVKQPIEQLIQNVTGSIAALGSGQKVVQDVRETVQAPDVVNRLNVPTLPTFPFPFLPNVPNAPPSTQPFAPASTSPFLTFPSAESNPALPTQPLTPVAFNLLTVNDSNTQSIQQNEATDLIPANNPSPVVPSTLLQPGQETQTTNQGEDVGLVPLGNLSNGEFGQSSFLESPVSTGSSGGTGVLTAGFPSLTVLSPESNAQNQPAQVIHSSDTADGTGVQTVASSTTETTPDRPITTTSAPQISSPSFGLIENVGESIQLTQPAKSFTSQTINSHTGAPSFTSGSSPSKTATNFIPKTEFASVERDGSVPESILALLQSFPSSTSRQLGNSGQFSDPIGGQASELVVSSVLPADAVQQPDQISTTAVPSVPVTWTTSTSLPVTEESSQATDSLPNENPADGVAGADKTSSTSAFNDDNVTPLTPDDTVQPHDVEPENTEDATEVLDDSSPTPGPLENSALLTSAEEFPSQLLVSHEVPEIVSVDEHKGPVLDGIGETDQVAKAVPEELVPVNTPSDSLFGQPVPGTILVSAPLQTGPFVIRRPVGAGAKPNKVASSDSIDRASPYGGRFRAYVPAYQLSSAPEYTYGHRQTHQLMPYAQYRNYGQPARQSPPAQQPAAAERSYLPDPSPTWSPYYSAYVY